MFALRFSSTIALAAAALTAAATTSCTTVTWYDRLRDPQSDYYTRSWDGTRNYGYPGQPRHDITVDQAVFDATTPSNSRLEISLSEQKARLFRVAEGRTELSVETPVSTGKEGYRTPGGSFKILEKLPKKTSSLYGFWVDPGSGAVLDRDGDSRRPPGGRTDLEFRGAPMPYWLRLTNSGVGIHEGFVPNVPASHGCIRIPRRAQQLIYQKVAVGTPVTIRH